MKAREGRLYSLLRLAHRDICINLHYLKVTVSCRIIQNKMYPHLPIYNLAEKEKGKLSPSDQMQGSPSLLQRTCT